MRSPAAGVSLLEMLLSLSLLSILFVGAFQVVTLQADLLEVAEHNNEALLALDSMCAFAQASIAATGRVTEADLRGFAATFAGIRPIQLRRLPVRPVMGSASAILELSMTVPLHRRRASRRYVREVLIP